jgi:hypothetical protein
VGTIEASATTPETTWLGSTTLQIALAMLEEENAMPYNSNGFVCITSPVGAQHLKNERDTGGFRYVTARNNGEAGNDIFRGTIGMTEGAQIVVTNSMPSDTTLVIGRDALAKVFSTGEGYGQNPSSVVSPVTDKLRRFLHWGWLHYVGYSLFDVRSVVKITHSDAYRPAGAENVGTGPGDVTPAVW